MEKKSKYDLYGMVIEEINEILQEKEDCEKNGEQYEDGTARSDFEGFALSIVKMHSDGKYKFATGDKLFIPEEFDSRLEALLFMRDNLDYICYWSSAVLGTLLSIKVPHNSIK